MISTDRCRASFVSWERVDLRGWTLGWLVVSSLRRADFLSSPHWLRAVPKNCHVGQSTDVQGSASGQILVCN